MDEFRAEFDWKARYTVADRIDAAADAVSRFQAPYGKACAA